MNLLCSRLRVDGSSGSGNVHDYDNGDENKVATSQNFEQKSKKVKTGEQQGGEEQIGGTQSLPIQATPAAYIKTD